MVLSISSAQIAVNYLKKHPLISIIASVGALSALYYLFSQTHVKAEETPSKITDLGNRVTLPQKGREYRTIEDLLPEDDYERFVSLTRSIPMIRDPRECIFVFIPDTTLSFSALHKLEGESIFWSEIGLKNPFLQKVYRILLNRFAEELSLVGRHTICMQVTKYWPKCNRTTSQGWHFDLATSYTMGMEIYNDFPRANKDDKGLDISYNAIPGPFSAVLRCREEDASPLNGAYTSLSYPRNGALIFQGKQGGVIHRMSTLAAKIFPADKPDSRATVQIFLNDPHWK